MKENVELKLLDKVVMKKTHPCGGNVFTIKRLGADIGIKCDTCGHYVMVPRNKIIKNIKEVL